MTERWTRRRAVLLQAVLWAFGYVVMFMCATSGPAIVDGRGLAITSHDVIRGLVAATLLTGFVAWAERGTKPCPAERTSAA